MVARVKETLGITKSRVQEIYNFQLDPVITEDKLINRKDWFRQNNAGRDDIKERPNKIWGKCEKEQEFNSKSDSGINFIVIFLLLTKSKWFQIKFVKVLSVFLKIVSVLHVNIRDINKHLEKFKHFWNSTPYCMFSMII